MKAVYAIVLVFALLLGANAAPNPRQINGSVLEHRLRPFLKPGFRVDISKDLQNYFEITVRRWIKKGNEDLGIPVTDPYERVRPLDINLDQDGLVLHGFVENVKINGASNFVVEKLKSETNETTLSAEIEFSLASAKLEGDYVLDGTLLNGALPVYGEGRFQLEVLGSTLKAKFLIRVKEEEEEEEDRVVELKDLELDLSVGSAKANFENLLGGGVLGELGNNFISAQLPRIAEGNARETLDKLIPEFKKVINANIVPIKLEDLVDRIKNPTKKA